MITKIGKCIQQAQHWLKKGMPIALPTETVYGLAGNAYDPTSVAAVFSIKERPATDPLIVHSPSIEHVASFVQSFPQKALALAQTFWPGPMTLLLNKKKSISDTITAQLPSVAVRIPNHPLVRSLLHALPFPVVAPSANPFGYISPTTSQHVYDQLQGKIPYILDGDQCTIGIESTIIGFEKDAVIIHRLGGLSIKSITDVVGPVLVHTSELATSIPLTPGNFPSHYAPKTPLIIGKFTKLLAQYQHKKIGVLTFNRPLKQLCPSQQIMLSPQGHLSEAAKNLFFSLRKLDNCGFEILLSEFLPNNNIGQAINDRLTRAARIVHEPILLHSQSF